MIHPNVTLSSYARLKRLDTLGMESRFGGEFPARADVDVPDGTAVCDRGFDLLGDRASVPNSFPRPVDPAAHRALVGAHTPGPRSAHAVPGAGRRAHRGRYRGRKPVGDLAGGGLLGLVEPTPTGRLWTSRGAVGVDEWTSPYPARLSALEERRSLQVRFGVGVTQGGSQPAQAHTAFGVVRCVVSLEAAPAKASR